MIALGFAANGENLIYHFFYLSGHKPDLQRPYLSTHFDKPWPEVFETDMNKFHRNPSILALGILLIEIDLARPIETYRNTTDNVNLNTDWITAHNIVKFMDQCSDPYKKAIRACLDIPWMPAGQNVSLEDSKTRLGLYINVIHPLESELDYLFPKQKKASTRSSSNSKPDACELDEKFSW